MKKILSLIIVFFVVEGLYAQIVSRHIETNSVTFYNIETRAGQPDWVPDYSVDAVCSWSIVLNTLTNTGYIDVNDNILIVKDFAEVDVQVWGMGVIDPDGRHVVFFMDLRTIPTLSIVEKANSRAIVYQ